MANVIPCKFEIIKKKKETVCYTCEYQEVPLKMQILPTNLLKYLIHSFIYSNKYILSIDYVRSTTLRILR